MRSANGQRQVGLMLEGDEMTCGVAEGQLDRGRRRRSPDGGRRQKITNQLKIDQQMFIGSIGHIYLVFNHTTSLIQNLLSPNWGCTPCNSIKFSILRQHCYLSMVDGVHPLTARARGLALQTIIAILYILPLGNFTQTQPL